VCVIQISPYGTFPAFVDSSARKVIDLLAIFSFEEIILPLATNLFREILVCKSTCNACLHAFMTHNLQGYGVYVTYTP
jgi:hypothetical protein